MNKEKFVLVSTNDESMMIDNEVFDNLEDAQKAMREEWESQDPDEDYDDYIREMDALVNGSYVYLWKIIKVTF